MDSNGRLIDGVVRVLSVSGSTTGAGFVIDGDGLVVTCAHVVTGGPDAAVTVVFQTSGERRRARVQPAYWRDPDHGDVAFLEIDGVLPDGAHPLALGRSEGTQGHRFRTFGYPAMGPDQGQHGRGTISGPVRDNDMDLLQLSTSEITRGFSGGPVYDESTRRVVGMTNAILRPSPDDHPRGADSAFAIPVETLRTVCERLAPSAECPYRNLDAFAEGDAEFFRGRKHAVADLLEALKGNPEFVAVLGPSGCGKSSLVQAGVLPRLREYRPTGGDRWHVITAHRGEHPLLELGKGGLRLAEDLATSVSAWQREHPGARLALVLDQFEELLVAAKQGLRDAFLAQLCTALESAQPLTVLVVMRDDFYARLAEVAPDLMRLVAKSQFNVPATLEDDDLRDMIASPASAVGLRFEPGLVERIVDDVAAASGSEGKKARSTALPLLEFTLTQLWERGSDGQLTHQAYEQIGRVTGGLAQWCDQALDDLNTLNKHDDDRDDLDAQLLHETTQAVVTALVHLGSEADGVPHSRRRRTLPELRTHQHADVVDRVVAHLTARRLLVTSAPDKDPDQGPATVELVHDALIREWPALRKWLDDDRAFLAWRQLVEDQAKAWTNNEKDESRLLRGGQLVDADQWSARHLALLSSLVREFIAASRRLREREAARDRRRLQRLRALSAVLAIALMLAGAFSAVAVAQRRSAQRERDLATAQRLAGQAAANSDQQPLSLLLSLESLRLAPTDEARAALLRGVLDPRHNSVALTGHTSAVYGVAFSPDGAMAASGSADRTVRRWNPRTGEAIGQPLAGHRDTVRMVAFSPDGKVIASASEDGTVRLWDARTSAPLGRPLIGHTDQVEAVAFSPDGTMIASAGLDRTVRRWDAATGAPIGAPLAGHTDQVEAVAFSPDGAMIASASEDQTLRRWDARTGAAIGAPLAGHTDQVEAVAFSPDGVIIASGSEDQTVRRWDAHTGAPIGEPLRGHTDQVEAVAFSPDSALIASAGLDQTVRLWDARTGAPASRPLIGHTDQIDGVAFSPDGRAIASGSADRTVRLWSAAVGAPIGPRLTGHTESVDGVAFSPDGSTVVTGSADHSIRLWDATTGALVNSFIGHTEAVVTVAFSPDGKTIVSGSRDRTVRRWDAATGEAIGQPMRGHTDWVLEVVFSADGGIVASASGDGTVRRWDTRTGASIGDPLSGHTDQVEAVAFSPDGAMLATGGEDWTVRLWETSSGAPIKAPLVGHTGEIEAVAFSPDGAVLATGGDDRTVRLWETGTGAPIGQPLTGLTHSVQEVAFSADGTVVLAAGEDGTVRRWETKTGAPIGQPLTGSTDKVDGMAFSPDGAMIAAAGTDRIVRLWPLHLDAWVRHACALADRNLTQDEWDRFLGQRPYRRTCPNLPPGLGAPTGRS